MPSGKRRFPVPSTIGNSINRLAEGDATVTQLAEPFPITMQAVSRHLQVLEHAGFFERMEQRLSR